MQQLDILNHIPKKYEGDISSPHLYLICSNKYKKTKEMITYHQFIAKLNLMRKKRWIRLTKFENSINYFQQNWKIVQIPKHQIAVYTCLLLSFSNWMI